MDVLLRFKMYLEETLQIRSKESVLLAVSGGKDSMLMAFLFRHLGYKAVIAHCNFQLRGEESDLDEKLVKDYAKQLGFPFVSTTFNTEAYAKSNGISIQMAARDLRYSWFEEIRQTKDISWVAVAQHRNDHLETVLVNLTRGVGLQGLQGILPKRGHIIRPILFLSSEEVTQFVVEQGIPYRDDQSNFSTKYARNKIRLEIIPKFKEIAPDFETVFADNIVHFQEAYQLLESFISPIRKRVFIVEGDGTIRIEREKLQAYLQNVPLLYALFKPYGFSKAVLNDLSAQGLHAAGRIFESPTHRLWIDREWLYLKPLSPNDREVRESIILEQEGWHISFGQHIFSVETSTDVQIVKDSNLVCLDYDKLVFPLTLRFWKRGDIFYPLGMKGKKKLSDFFIQEKIPLFKKGDIPLLVNGNGDILWVVNYRMDNRYKITESTKKVFTLVCN